ncbi:uncharacterized protein LOC123988026 [Osmia bicornis bicornis]|uniref:uncharacterized protein LOC123988026 n=1 Tax=Osmia bicornis bicornis TaxID=1437191 RepID=UPI001EAF39AF|nr:uncharacterized protein LOC123988026 [Osmia bicornis bicornis]
MTAQEEMLKEETPPPTPPPPPPPQWRLVTVDIPEFDWRTYKSTERTDPRHNHGQIMRYFGILSASPRNSEEKCCCALCNLKRRNHCLLRTRDKRAGEVVTTR